MRKFLLTTVASLLVVLSGAGLSFAQDGSDVPNLVPIEMSVCNYRDGKDSDDYDNATDMMKKWMEDNDGEPYASFLLSPFFAGDQEFDFVSVGVWTSGASMGKDMANWGATAGDEIAAMDDAVDCRGSTMFTSLNVMQPSGDGPDSFVLTVTDCNVADGRSTRDAVGALREYGEYRNATGSPGRMWVWFPTYGNGDEDYNFKLASSYASVEAFGNNFQWNRDNQAYLKRSELFNGLLDCNVARSYTGKTIVNTIPAN
jgi:hypothetical protein